MGNLYYTGFDRVAKSTGRKVVLVDGWEKRGYGGMSGVRSVICHHTAGPKGSNYPSLGVVRDGRAGLAGPLAQFGIGRDGTIYVIAAGRANHAGRASATKYSNPYAIGIEAENTGLGEPWSNEIMISYVALVVALVKEFKLSVNDVRGHKEIAVPKGRKIDPYFKSPNISMGTFRGYVKAGKYPAKGRPAPVDNKKPVTNKPSPKDQSPSNPPNGSTTFPDNYAELNVNGNFRSWEIGALQILLENVINGENKQWDGKFGKLTVTDFMELLQRNGYYIKTPFAAKGVPAGTPLEIDGEDGYWFWIEVQRMLGNAEGNRGNGKVYYNLKRYKLDGDPASETYKGIQRWLNDNN